MRLPATSVKLVVMKRSEITVAGETGTKGGTSGTGDTGGTWAAGGTGGGGTGATAARPPASRWGPKSNAGSPGDRLADGISVRAVRPRTRPARSRSPTRGAPPSLPAPRGR